MAITVSFLLKPVQKHCSWRLNPAFTSETWNITGFEDFLRNRPIGRQEYPRLSTPLRSLPRAAWSSPLPTLMCGQEVHTLMCGQEGTHGVKQQERLPTVLNSSRGYPRGVYTGRRLPTWCIYRQRLPYVRYSREEGYPVVYRQWEEGYPVVYRQWVEGLPAVHRVGIGRSSCCTPGGYRRVPCWCTGWV